MKTELSPQDELLYSLWQRAQPGRNAIPADENTWHRAIMQLEKLGRGMEETMRHLFMQQPTFPDFMTWVHASAASAQTDEERLEEDVLTREDLAFWEENGYIVVRNAVSRQQAADAAEAIWQHLGASAADPETWYKTHEDLRGLMLTFYHHPALETNRRSARLRKAYEQLYGTADIHRNLDKVSFNPPQKKGYTFMGSPLHWDVSLQLPIPFRLQGLLYLTDTDAENGAFYCVPGFHRTIGNWLDSLPQDANPRDEAVSTLKPIPITGNAGDFIIWHQALPHCATPNNGNAPRLVQYFTYLNPGIKDQEVWK